MSWKGGYSSVGDAQPPGRWLSKCYAVTMMLAPSQRQGVPGVKAREDLELEVHIVPRSTYSVGFKRLNQRDRRDSRSAHGGCCRPGMKIAATRLNVRHSPPKHSRINLKVQAVGMLKLMTGWIVERSADPDVPSCWN